jgi:WS/DGAT/MGAT family acyltransferase
MQKLAAIDANFLYTETEKMPNHISSFQILELPENTTVDGFIEGIKLGYKERLHLLPYLYRKIQFVPGNFDHPVWVTDTDFDVDNHVFKEVLPKPGTFQQLEEKIAEIHTCLLDRDKPLWKLCIITGLENENQIAYYSCAHHACLDGVAGTEAHEIMMDPTPEVRQFQPPEDFPPEDGGGLPELISLSLQNLIKTQIDAPNRIMNVMDTMSRLTRRAIDPARSFGAAALQVPKTRFNRSIESVRKYAAGDFLISDLKAMKKVAGCKLNDVFLAICAGGLRRYLERSNDLPDIPMIAGVPVSLRKPGNDDMNTQVVMMNVSLATDIEDPRERLLSIRKSAKVAKKIVKETITDFNPDVSMFGLPALITQNAQLMDAFGMADAMPVPMNLVISNVPGPRNTLYSAGAKLLAHYPVSIPAHGLGVNITVQSYVDRFYFGITACARTLPDAAVLRDDIVASFQELMDVLLPEEQKIPELEIVATRTVDLDVADAVSETISPSIPADFPKQESESESESETKVA